MWRARYLVKAALSEGWRDAKNIVRRVVSEGASFSLNDLDRELERYLNSRAGYYVELGANDGITQSNTLLFEIKYGWSGLLIEPAPHNFMKCKRL